MPTIKFYRAIGQWGFLSNLFLRELQFDARTFRSSEDAYQYAKPRVQAVADWLVGSPSPRLTALAAHALFWYDVSPQWRAIKVDRMRAVLRAKFSQHADLAERLMATGDSGLVEDSKSDGFWGIGKNGKGKNMLGQLLMEIRDELRRTEASAAENQRRAGGSNGGCH